MHPKIRTYEFLSKFPKNKVLKKSECGVLMWITSTHAKQVHITNGHQIMNNIC